MEVSALQRLVIEEGTLLVISAFRRSQEAITNQIAGAHFDLERLPDPHLSGRGRDDQGRVVRRRSDLTELGGHALVAGLETVVQWQFAVVAGVSQNGQGLRGRAGRRGSRPAGSTLSGRRCRTTLPRLAAVPLVGTVIHSGHRIPSPTGLRIRGNGADPV